MKTLFLLSFVLFSFELCFCQLDKQAWHWHFGQSSGSVNFNNGFPTHGSSQISTMEGSASISDPISGQLLFYTDGATVWNKNNSVMPNGTGLISFNGINFETSTQAALIVPKPGSNKLYYLITADQGGNAGPNQGIFFSVIDMNLNGGLGDVTVKNHLLTPPPTTEKLTAIRSCDGSFSWVVVHAFNSDAFYSYRLDSTGIDTIPVITHSGSLHQNNSGLFLETIGYMKASPNGQKLAVAVSLDTVPFIEIFDFNILTGQLSNPFRINYPNTYGPYGITFSPDNSKLYCTVDVGGSPNLLCQYDLTGPSPYSIIQSEIRHYSLDELWAMQIGPDGKIYINGTGPLFCLDHPNSTGINMSTALQMYAGGLGLPNFIDGYTATFLKDIRDVYKCDTFSMDTLDAGPNFTSYLWSTGDTTQAIIINSPGVYWVRVLNPVGCTETDTIHVYQLFSTDYDLLSDTLVCNNTGTYSVNVSTNGASSYEWNDSTNNPLKTFTHSGDYEVTLSFNGGCIMRDSFHLILGANPTINLGWPIVKCASSDTLKINSNFSCVWSTGDTAHQIVVTNTGYYSVEITTPEGCMARDSVHVGLYSPPLIDNLHDTSLCSNNHYLNIDAFIPNANSYVWNDGTTFYYRTLTTPGLYWVKYTLNTGCQAIDSFQFVINPSPVTYLKDSTLCYGQIKLEVTSPQTTFLWNTGETSSTIYANTPGIYQVTLQRGKCFSTTSISIKDIPNLNDTLFPNVITPNGDGINDYIYFTKSYFSRFRIIILDRWGKKVVESEELHFMWWAEEVTDGTYYFIVEYEMECNREVRSHQAKGFITVIR